MELASRVAVPAAKPTTLPFSTFATAGLFDLHVIAWSAASEGTTVTLGKSLLSPSLTLKVLKERLSDSTALGSDG